MPVTLDLRRAAAEALGTFFLVLIGPGTAAVNAYTGGQLGVVGIALAFAFVVIAMIHAIGHPGAGLASCGCNPRETLGQLPLPESTHGWRVAGDLHSTS